MLPNTTGTRLLKIKANAHSLRRLRRLTFQQWSDGVYQTVTARARKEIAELRARRAKLARGFSALAVCVWSKRRRIAGFARAALHRCVYVCTSS